MKIKRSGTILLAAIYAATMVTSLATGSLSTDAATTCVVDLSKSYQSIVGFGGIQIAEWTADKGGDLTAAQRQKVFGNGKDELGFTVLRVFISPDTNAWKNPVATAKFAQEQGATIFATPWEPPSNLCESGGNYGKLHLKKENYGAYAKHLNDFGNYMKNQGVDLYSISVQNEPDYADEWTYWTADETTDFLANYGDQITSAKVMSPESFQYSPASASWLKVKGGKNYYTSILNNAKAFENTDLFGTHFYGTTRDWMNFPELENCGKQIWMTEVYVPNSNANSADNWPEAVDVAENIHNGLVVGNMSAYVWWSIRRSYSPLKEDGNISKRGYCMAQYSKFVRPGDVRVEVTEQPNGTKSLVSAYLNSNKQVTIVAVNKGDEYVQKFEVGGNTSITSVDRYRTTSSENLAYTSNMELADGGFYATLPSNSVSTFIVSLEGSVPTVTPGQTTVNYDPDENGIYFENKFEGTTDSWTARGASDILTSGRTAYEGGESLLVENRTSAWNGASLSLNTRQFVPGNAYSFSVNTTYFDGDDTDTFYLKLQYTGSDGETHYDTIAEGTGVKGQWLQLANENYTIPTGATNVSLYVETAETTNNFYIDDAVGAVAGTKIQGAGQPVIATTTTTTTTTTNTTTSTTMTTTTTTVAEQSAFLKGDVNVDDSVSTADVVLFNKALKDDVTLSDRGKLNADVDGDGNATSTDIAKILKYLAGVLTYEEL